MSTWYRTNRTDEKIEPVEVVKETAHFVTLAPSGFYSRERREAKSSEWYSYFPTWKEAHAHLMERTERKVIEARRALELANAEHGNVRGMKEPAA